MPSLLWSVLLLSFLPQSAPAQAPGLPPDWELKENMAALEKHLQRFNPILDEVQPESWAEKGAPGTYEQQWRSVQQEIGFLIPSASQLGSQPERLTLALEILFRIHSLDSMLRSMDEGIRKYQNPALADLLRATMTGVNLEQEKLRQYVVALAAAKEQEWKIMDQEAQRCRAWLSRHPQQENSGRKAESK